MGNRYIVTPPVERMPAGGGFDEWFDVTTRTSTGHVLDMTGLATQRDQVAALLFSLIVDWSLEESEGVKLPITQQNFEGLDPVLTAPLFERMQKLSESFLALASLTTNK